MKRWGIGLLLFCGALAACSSDAQAGQLFQRLKRERDKYPPKYTRAPNLQYYVFRDREGQVKVREVYPGYTPGNIQALPIPALFYYGYPHSGDDTGIGF